MISESKIAVRYAETDAMGVVYHANYLVWFEIARTEFLQKLGFPYAALEEKGIMAPVLHMECDYGMPLHYDETAIIRTKVIEVTGVKTIFAYEVYRDDQTPGIDKPCCTGSSTHCLVYKDSFRPLSMKKITPDLYEAYLSAREPQ